MRTLTMKFGGTAVGTTAALTQVLSIVLHESERWDQLLIVTSSLDGVTDMLLEAAHLAQLSNQRGYRRIAATIRTRHLALVEQLPFDSTERRTLNAELDQLFFDMLDLCQSLASKPADKLLPETSDQIAGVGEQLASRIIAALLRHHNLRGAAIDATDLIITDSTHGNAVPNLALTRQNLQDNLQPLLDSNIIPVITGFIASSPDGQITTLGRGGSDYTASILGVCTDSDEVWIWSDVDGMMSGDPRELPNAKVIPTLSYNEVAELAYFGARILHARMIQPLREHAIPLRIRNVYKPRESGTLIQESTIKSPASLKAVTMIHGIALTANYSGSLAQIIELVDGYFFQLIGSHTDVMFSSQSSSASFLAFIVPTSAGMEAVEPLYKGVQAVLDTSPDSSIWQVKPVFIVTGIGESIPSDPQIISSMLNALGNVQTLEIGLGPSNCSISIIVQPDEADYVLDCIHTCILEKSAKND